MIELFLGFTILSIFILARRMNRDEDIIVELRHRVNELEDVCGISRGEVQSLEEWKKKEEA